LKSDGDRWNKKKTIRKWIKKKTKFDIKLNKTKW
jgi:hypothetical protein